MKHLFDPWSRSGPIPLDNPLERWGMPPLFMAVLLLVVGFITFQLIGTLSAWGILAQQGYGPLEVAERFGEIAAEQIEVLIISNSVGQIFGLALLTLLVTWLHTSRVNSFLRIRSVDFQMLSWSVVGIIALLPVVWWLGFLNEQVPIPEWMMEMEEARMQIIESVIVGDAGIVFAIAFMAVVPSICEELFFRGYVQRQFERSSGIVVGIMLSGILFGAYHLSALQILPLATLGIYLAYITWRTGSLWPAIAAHLVNNSIAILAAQTAPAEEARITEVETMQMPWYIVLAGLLFFVCSVYFLDQRAREVKPAEEERAQSPTSTN